MLSVRLLAFHSITTLSPMFFHVVIGGSEDRLISPKELNITAKAFGAHLLEP